VTCAVVTRNPPSAEIVAAGHGFGMWKTIVVAHDFSQAANDAAVLARDEAAAHGGRIILLHVLDAPLAPEAVVDIVDGVPGPAPATIHTPVSFHDRVTAEASTRLAEVAAELDIREAAAFVRWGKTDDEIVKLAREVGADVIVVGAHDHLIGSGVAERIVRKCTTPVLVIPSAVAA